MRLSLITAVSLSVFGVAITAHAEGEGAGDPFPFRAPGVVIAHPSSLADRGSAAYPNFSSRPAQLVAEGQGILPPNGSEGAVQTAASLPPGSLDGTAAILQAKSTDRFFAMAAARRSTRLPGHSSRG